MTPGMYPVTGGTVRLGILIHGSMVKIVSIFVAPYDFIPVNQIFSSSYTEYNKNIGSVLFELIKAGVFNLRSTMLGSKAVTPAGLYMEYIESAYEFYGLLRKPGREYPITLNLIDRLGNNNRIKNNHFCIFTTY